MAGKRLSFRNEFGQDAINLRTVPIYDMVTGRLEASTRWERHKDSRLWVDTGELLNDTIVYFLHHTDKDDQGFVDSL